MARRIVVTEFMTLDGVVENPTWSFPYWNDEIRDFKAHETRPGTELLLGRTTYEQFAQAWPQAKDEGAAYFNPVRKHVVSTTRTKDVWQNATFVSGSGAALKEKLQRLKKEGDGELVVHGSVTLARWLLEEGLVDELRLLVYPVTNGGGTRLFDGQASPGKMRLASARPTSNGVLRLVYEPEWSA